VFIIIALLNNKLMTNSIYYIKASIYDYYDIYCISSPM